MAPRFLSVLPIIMLIACNGGYSGPIDVDGDGYASPEDCDDTDPAIHPDADDVCDDRDNDCDGEVDENPAGIFYPDLDGDGFGTDDPTAACEGDGWAEVGSGADEDCNDDVATINPDANEICNEIDDDCDGMADNTDNSWYADADGDTFGDLNTSSETCQPGYVSDATDCNDGDGGIYPGADEHCDGFDENCEGSIDENPVDPTTWYADTDSDGHGDPDTTVDACSQPADHVGVADADDCNDADDTIFPGAEEQCDSKDNDCDSEVDETPPTWYADADGDGHGDSGVSSQGCDPPDITWVSLSDDCNDAVDTIYPLAPETCNDTDDDCDTEVDEDAIDKPTWYLDSDVDGYGVATSTAEACDAPSGYVDNTDDCNDGDIEINPDTLWYPDVDTDTFGETGGTTMAQCEQPAGHVRDNTDCNDGDISINPSTVWYPDTDGDTYGETGGTTMVQCAQPTDHVQDNTDCNDGDEDYHPLTEWWIDTDGDDYGDEGDLTPTIQCANPGTSSIDHTDCDDTTNLTNPGITAACDAVDRDCDGGVDNDADGDGYIRPGCAGGYDCDDSDDTAFLTDVGKNNGSCTGLPADCTEFLADYPLVDDGTYWLTPNDGVGIDAQYYCDMTTDGGGWTLVVSTDAGDDSQCNSTTRFDDAVSITVLMGTGGEVLSKFYDSNDVTATPESVLKFSVGGGAGYSSLIDLWAFGPSASWQQDGATNFGLTTISGTSYGNQLYWNSGATSNQKRNLCIGGAEGTAGSQVCLYEGTSTFLCGFLMQANTYYVGAAGGGPPSNIKEDRTHELYVRAP